jgi:hypothetical protein
LRINIVKHPLDKIFNDIPGGSADSISRNGEGVKKSLNAMTGQGGIGKTVERLPLQGFRIRR